MLVVRASRNSVVFDGSFMISHLFQKVGTNGVETIVTGNARVAVESPKQFEAFGRAVHHSGCDGVIESEPSDWERLVSATHKGQNLWPVCVLGSLGFVVNGGDRCLNLIQAH